MKAFEELAAIQSRLCLLTYKDHEIEMRKADPPYRTWHVSVNGKVVSLSYKNKKEALTMAKFWINERLRELSEAGFIQKKEKRKKHDRIN